MSNLIAKEYKGFEDIKHTDNTGTEFWLARELAEVLQYKDGVTSQRQLTEPC